MLLSFWSLLPRYTSTEGLSTSAPQPCVAVPVYPYPHQHGGTTQFDLCQFDRWKNTFSLFSPPKKLLSSTYRKVKSNRTNTHFIAGVVLICVSPAARRSKDHFCVLFCENAVCILYLFFCWALVFKIDFVEIAYIWKRSTLSVTWIAFIFFRLLFTFLLKMVLSWKKCWFLIESFLWAFWSFWVPCYA